MYKKSYGMDTQIVRFYNVYGPGEIVDGDWAAVVGKWRRQVRDGESITIVGDGEQRRDFTHIDDIVDGLIKIMNTEHSVEDAWELGTGENYSINELYEMFNDRFGVDKVYIDDQIGNYRVTLRERDDALDVLGWSPTDKLKDYIKSL
jgi:UDP-glucose 4-epimerase